MAILNSVARIARVVAVGAPHHVTQRGNNRQQVFFSAADRRIYLALLASHCRRRQLTLLGYCLMPNHVHPAGADLNDRRHFENKTPLRVAMDSGNQKAIAFLRSRGALEP